MAFLHTGNLPPQLQTMSTLKDNPPQPPMTSFRHPSSSARPKSLPPTALSAAWTQRRLAVWEFAFESCPNEVDFKFGYFS